LNARIRYRLRKDFEYVRRIRLYYADRVDESAVMLW
jgi:hypothetical protein